MHFLRPPTPPPDGPLAVLSRNAVSQLTRTIPNIHNIPGLAPVSSTIQHLKVLGAGADACKGGGDAQDYIAAAAAGHGAAASFDLHSHHQASITIANHTHVHYKVFWLDFEGNREDCHTVLPPFGRFFGQTFSTHPFVVAAQDDQAVGIFIAELGDCYSYVLPYRERVKELETKLVSLPLTMENSLRSIKERSLQAASFIRIANHTDRQYKLIWIDYEGNRVARNVIPPLQTIIHLASASHPFIVLDSEFEDKGQIFVAEKGYCLASIECA